MREHFRRLFQHDIGIRRKRVSWSFWNHDGHGNIFYRSYHTGTSTIQKLFCRKKATVIISYQILALKSLVFYFFQNMSFRTKSLEVFQQTWLSFIFKKVNPTSHAKVSSLVGAQHRWWVSRLALYNFMFFMPFCNQNGIIGFHIGNGQYRPWIQLGGFVNPPSKSPQPVP